jgi:hypothetical protein
MSHARKVRSTALAVTAAVAVVAAGLAAASGGRAVEAAALVPLQNSAYCL